MLTNFDTLLEKAFEQENVLYTVYDSPENYVEKNVSKHFPIYKLHGSAGKTQFAIDTVHQKMQGLSLEKQEVLKRLFAENHIIFMGFSGEDYLFGTDYIPVKVNREKGFGITWISYPGSNFNSVTEKIIQEEKIEVIQIKLLDFYRKQKWDIPECSKESDIENYNFKSVARERIFKLLNEPHIGHWACLGMCIELLDILGDTEKADETVCQTKKKLEESRYIDLTEGLHRMSLYSNLAEYSIRRNDSKDAMKFLNIQKKIFEIQMRAIELYEQDNGILGKKNELLKEIMFNESTVDERIGRVLLVFNEEYDKAAILFWRAFYHAYRSENWENMASALLHIAITELEKWRLTSANTIVRQRFPHFVAVFESARRVAERGGYAQIIFEVNCMLAQVYTMFAQKKLAVDALKRAEQICGLGIDIKKNVIRLNDARNIVQLCENGIPWCKGHMELCMPYEVYNTWEPYGQRQVLTCQEGRVARELFEKGNCEEALNCLITAAENYMAHQANEQAEMLFDCAAGIFMERANNATMMEETEKQVCNWLNAKVCYENCLSLEFSIGRLDYLVGTLGSLAKVNYLLGTPELIETAEYQAELTLCICEDPTECWQSVIAAETICNINCKKNNKIKAKKYCEKYLQMVSKAPWSAEPENIAYMRRLLSTLSEL